MSIRSLLRLISIGVAVVLAVGCSAPSGLRPISDRPISLDARCTGIGQTGLRETSQLTVHQSAVRALSWHVDGGVRGQCRFELEDFRQTRARPHIELVARSGNGCQLMIWRDPRHITLSHAGCDRQCPSGLLTDALPVIFDPAGGGCAAS